MACSEFCPIAKGAEQRAYQFFYLPDDERFLEMRITLPGLCRVAATQRPSDFDFYSVTIPSGSRPTPDCKLADCIKKILETDGAMGTHISCGYIPQEQVYMDIQSLRLAYDES
jgi:hypothetical protein